MKKDFQFFIGYKDGKMIAYRRDFEETKCMSFLIKNDQLLRKYNEIWDKVSNVIEKEFDSEPVHYDKYLINDNKVPKEGSQCIYLSTVLIDSGFRTSKKQYPQGF